MVVRSTKGYESITGTIMNGDPSRTVMKERRASVNVSGVVFLLRGGGAGCPHNLGHPQPTRGGDARLARR